jgi:hypothetical protein
MNAKKFDSTTQLRAANNALSARVGVATAQTARDLSEARQLANGVAGVPAPLDSIGSFFAEAIAFEAKRAARLKALRAAARAARVAA